MVHLSKFGEFYEKMNEILFKFPNLLYIVTCQVHPVLVKTGQMYGPLFKKKIVGSYY